MRSRVNPLPLTATHRLLLVLSCLFVTGCAGISYRLEPASAARVESAKVRSLVPQSDLAIKVLTSTYGGGFGLIGALVDSGVNKRRGSDAERRVAPLLKEVQDVDLRARLWEELVPAIHSVEWPRVVDVQTAPASAPVTTEDVKESAFVSLTTTYNLSPNASVFEMHSYYTFFLRGNTSPAAFGSVSYWSKEIGKGVDGKTKEDEDAIALWSAAGGAAYRTAVDEGIRETVRMLGLALPFVGGKQVGSLGEATEVKYDATHGRGDFGLKASRTAYRGAVLERGPERLVFRVESGSFFPGSLFSVPAAEVEERRQP